MLSGRSRTVVAVVLASAGVAAAAWSVMSLQRRPAARSPERRAARGPESSGTPTPPRGAPSREDLPPGAEQRIVHDTGGDQGPPVDPLPQGPFDFRPVASDAEFADAGDAIEPRVLEAARAMDWLDTARGDHRTAASAARLALAAPARGREAFDAAVAELKGDAQAGDSEAGTLVAMFQGATIDVSHLRIKQAAQEPLMGGPRPSGDANAPAKARMMMRVERSGDGPDEEEATIGIPVQTLFPQTADEVADAQPAIEIKCPARLPGVDVADGRAELGVILVRDRSTGIWQPIMYNLYARDRSAATAKAKAVREERQKQ